MNIKSENIIPTGKRLLIQPDEKATETEGGIILAGDEKNTAPVKGLILKAGQGSVFAEGQTVLFRRYAIDELKIQNGIEEQIVYFLDDTDVLASIKDEVELSREDKYPAIAAKKAIKALDALSGAIKENADEKTKSSSEKGSSKNG